ncbi:MAG: fluoride efflux transporter CrcB [Gammaproteobacteria bacterium]|nr:fluoride efflux transporter CrcB [Gammaproteobacteria bacterium]NVK87376.1 fluoride efflux transporter CrcB [Gammaproteobacteria bacterium]
MSITWPVVTAVALGSAFGGVSRYWLRESLPQWIKFDFPLSTLLVNVVGCLLAGVFMVYWQNSSVSPAIKTGVLIGFFGAFTTFSAFSADSWLLIQQDEYIKAGINIVLNMTLSLVAVFFGAWIGGKIAAN